MDQPRRHGNGIADRGQGRDNPHIRLKLPLNKRTLDKLRWFNCLVTGSQTRVTACQSPVKSREEHEIGIVSLAR